MEFHVYETERDGRGAPSARSSSSPRTTRRSCPTPSCAAASSTISSSPTARRCRRSSTSISPASRRCWSRKAMDIFYEVREVPGPQEEAVDQRAARLAEAAPPRGHAARSPPVARPDEGDPAAPRRAAQERAGRDAVRAAGVHGAARELNLPSQGRRWMGRGLHPPIAAFPTTPHFWHGHPDEPVSRSRDRARRL